MTENLIEVIKSNIKNKHSHLGSNKLFIKKLESQLTELFITLTY